MPASGERVSIDLCHSLRTSIVCGISDRANLTFRGAGVHVIDLDQKGRKAGAYAARVPVAREEVTFKNGDVTLAATLSVPASKGKHPAIVFTHGRGPRRRGSFLGGGK